MGLSPGARVVFSLSLLLLCNAQLLDMMAQPKATAGAATVPAAVTLPPLTTPSLATKAVAAAVPPKTLSGSKAPQPLIAAAGATTAAAPKDKPSAAAGGAALRVASPAAPAAVVPAAVVRAATNASSSAAVPGPIASPEQLALNRQLDAMAAGWRLTAQQAKAAGQLYLAGRIRVCAAAYTPNVYCKPEEPPEDMTGYAVEVFKEIAGRTYWLQDSRIWSLSCMDWTEMENDLQSPNGTCIMGLSMDLDPNSYPTLQPSRTIDKDGLMILIHMKAKKLSVFSPFYAFTWQLWLALFGTAVLIGGITWLFDTAMFALNPKDGKDKKKDKGPTIHPKFCCNCGAATVIISGDKSDKGSDDEDDDSGKANSGGDDRPANGAKESGAASSKDEAVGGDSGEGGGDDGKGNGKAKGLGHRMLRVLGVKDKDEKKTVNRLDENLRSSVLHLTRTSKPPLSITLPAQIILFAWGLLSMLVVSLYTGATAATLTAQQLNGDIKSRADLHGRAVGTWTGYQERLRNEEGLETIGMKWDNIEDEKALVAALRTGRVAAELLDGNFVLHTISTQCDMASVDLPFLISDNGYNFNPRVQRPLIDSLNAAILSAVTDGTIERLRATHVMNVGGICDRKKSTVKGTTAIRLKQVLGLWVALGLATLIATCVLIVSIVQNRRKHITRSLSRVASIAVSQPLLLRGLSGSVGGAALAAARATADAAPPNRPQRL